MELSTQWYALCDNHAPNTCTNQQVLIDQAHEAVKNDWGSLELDRLNNIQ